MAGLAEQLREAEAAVKKLRREIGLASCREIGEHDYQSSGGCNAGCCATCNCSVPVLVCSRCGDCDYGDNEFARKTRAECEARNGPVPHQSEGGR